jgi:tetratricopeptide (TPR) repeat protein
MNGQNPAMERNSMNTTTVRSGAFLLLAALILSACADADTKKRRHLEQGNQYAAEKRDDFAAVEYASAIKIDPMFGEARLKLAETYERMNNPAAYLEYVRAADALPDNRDAQLKATRILLMGGRFDDAKARAEALLQKDARDVDAILLRANAMAALRDPAGAVAQIEEAMKIRPDSSQAYVNLGAVRMGTGDAKQAEAAFRQAIALDPSSVDAKLALANFLWAANRAPEAESTLKEVLAKDPQHLLANRMLGLLYITTRRVNEAEQPLKTVAEVSKSPAARLQLGDYYLGSGRTKEATDLLTVLTSEPATAAEAEMRLAALDYSQKRQTEAHTRLDALLTRSPSNSAALVLKAQWLTLENKLDEALDRAKAAVAADGQSAAAHFALATVQERRREFADATKSYGEVLRLNPQAVAAQVQLSRLGLMTGDTASAVRFAEEAKQTQPTSFEARLVLARSLVMAGNLARAEPEIAQLLKHAPNHPGVHAVNGMYQTRTNNVPAARQAYQRALDLSPGFLEALSGLTYLDLTARNSAQAIARLEPEITRQPTSGALFVLLAQAHRVAGDAAKEEQALRRAVSVDPRLTDAYGLLAQFYLQHKRLDEARAEFEGMVKRDPSAVMARTMVGVLHEQQGNREEAKKAYTAAVRGSDNAPIAANNLAYIYAEEGTNLDEALQLATAAKQRMPDDANVDDTIGWIYYKKSLYDLALRAFEESLKKSPDNPEVLVHLGLTHAQLGDKARAREALERALKLNPRAGGEVARRVLASVSS